MRKLFFLLLLSGTVLNTMAQDTTNYTLVWSDEFEKDGPPDPANWGYEYGLVRNEEAQWYQPDNAYCEKGILIIEARKEQRLNPGYVPGSKDWKKKNAMVNYTSSCLITAGKKTWKYGRFEMRGRIDINRGLWPTWWTLGVEKSWPASGEIDMMEFYRGKLLANIACMGKDGKPEWFIKTSPVDSMGGAGWSAQFHVWRMDWTEDFIALYADDHLLNKVAVDSLLNKDGTGFNPFKQPHYMLLNLAVGGTNGGDPGNTSFPRRFEVDYVRVYQEE